ncbi:MAG: NAD(P)H-dependent oxidoreductase [Thermoguttaceae bacterium]|nr:NAD(P)H-dependent oxidoreductase [Thermoguttaceae bacterium]
MKVLVILGHPNPGESFNRAIVETACRTLREMGHEPVLRDLYAEKFDPVMPMGEEKLPIEELPESVRREIDAVREADGFVIVHPNWWGTPPAILKGWLDRVFRAGFAYSFSANGVVSNFTEKRAQVFTTSNTPRDVELEVYHDPLENFWKTIVFGLVGSRDFGRRNFESIIMSSPEERAAWLTEVEAIVKKRFAE